MAFQDLPNELILKIFSYLNHDDLEQIAEVCQRWMQLASDPSLFTVLCIHRRYFDNPLRMQEILERASMLHTLYIITDRAAFDILASVSTGLRLLKHLTIPGSALSHRAMPAIFENCKSLATIVLWGPHRLSANEVRTLETLHSLRKLVASDGLEICDEVLRQICSSCPRLERLELNSEHISIKESWDYIESLVHLRALSVSVISTAGLIRVSKSCLSLDTLEIGTVWNEGAISVAQALQGFLQLRSLHVIRDCGEGWLNQRFRAPPLLERLEVPNLVIEVQHFAQLILSFRETLKHVHINVSNLPDESLRELALCESVECLIIDGLGGKTIVFSILSKLPKLLRASLYIVADPANAVYQLISIVDPQDTSPRGKTRLVFNILCSMCYTHYMIRCAANAFIDHIALNTSMTPEHISEFGELCSTYSGQAFLPCSLETSFPTVNPTLKYLYLNLDGDD